MKKIVLTTLFMLTVVLTSSVFAKNTKNQKISRLPDQAAQVFFFNQKLSGAEVYQHVKAVGDKYDDSEQNDVISYKAEITCYNAGGTTNDYCEVKKLNQ